MENIKVFFIYDILKIGENMNNDLENLYGNNGNVTNNNNTNETQQSFNNNIPSEPQDLTSLYGNDNIMNVNNNSNTETNNNSDIMMNQEGLNKLYNQSTIDLDAEPVNEGKGPVVVKPKEEEVKKVVRNEYVTDEDLLVAYVGNNFEKIVSKPFNIAAFFFGNAYLYYRKKLLYGLILFVIETILSRYLNSFLVGIGIAVIMGLSFNSLYIYDAKAYIKDLKKKNPTLSNAELKEICKKTGGVSFIYIIVGILVSTFVGFVVAMFMVSLGLTKSSGNMNVNINDIINKNKNVYLGTVKKDTKIDITNKYTIEVPEGFTKETEDKNEYKYTQDNCNFSLYKALKETDAKKLAKEMSIYYLSIEDVKTTTNNKIKWYYVENNDGTEKKYHYVTSNNGEIYIFEYNTESKDKVCLNNKDKVLNSIKTK